MCSPFCFSIVFLIVFYMDYQRKGTCGHYMALVSVDPHDMCPGCRVCFVPDNPCLVCDALTSDQRAQSIQARRLRLRREERKRIARAGSIGTASPLRGRVNVDLGRGRALVLRGPP